jgi:hypothetical protein
MLSSSVELQPEVLDVFFLKKLDVVCVDRDVYEYLYIYLCSLKVCNFRRYKAES